MAKEFTCSIFADGRIRHYRLKVVNGEIVYTAEYYSEEKENLEKRDRKHDLINKCPNWEFVEKQLKDILYAQNQTFYKICEILDTGKKAYWIAVDLLQVRNNELVDELERMQSIICANT